MTREQAKQNLISIGVAEPTDEQVTNYLNQVNGETKKEKERADGLKAKADKSDELQAQIDALNEQNMTDIEKANKATELANGKIAELEKQIARSNQLTQLSAMGIVGEQAEKLIGENGLDYSILGQIISERESKAAIAKEQEIASKGGNPSGGAGGQGGTDKTAAEKVAETVTKSIGGVSKTSADIIANYTN